MKKQENIFLLLGATGAGKTTTIELMKTMFADQNIVTYELDRHVSDLANEELVVPYFKRIGFIEFYKKSVEAIEHIAKKHLKDKDKIILIDVGGGSTQDPDSYTLPERFHCIALTASPKYYWETRKKCRDTHKNFTHFRQWQFGELKKIMFESCEIKVDNAYIPLEVVCQMIWIKIHNFLKGFLDDKEFGCLEENIKGSEHKCKKYCGKCVNSKEVL